MANESAKQSAWTRVALGDVVERVSESRIPTSEESATYIGLEHLEGDSFAVNRWGSDVDIKVPKTLVKKGDVLFARRNTHLRRCAVAPFDAFFSPDGYAFRSKSKHLLHELLLYVVASDGFMDFAIQHSSGTHSKRVKWSDLQDYHFDLPPLQEQQRIVDVLSAVDRMSAARFAQIKAGERLFRSVLTGIVLGRHDSGPKRSSPLGPIPRHWSLEQLGDLAGFANGVSKPASEFGSGAPLINLGDVFSTTLLTSQPEDRVRMTEHELENLSVKRNDILFVRSSVKPDGVAKAALVDFDVDGVTFAGFLIRCRLESESLNPRFANLLFQGQHFRRLALSRSTVSLNTNINQGQLSALPVAFPTATEQVKIIDVCESIMQAKSAAIRRRNDDRALMRHVAGVLLRRPGT